MILSNSAFCCWQLFLAWCHVRAESEFIWYWTFVDRSVVHVLSLSVETIITAEVIATCNRKLSSRFSFCVAGSHLSLSISPVLLFQDHWKCYEQMGKDKIKASTLTGKAGLYCLLLHEERQVSNNHKESDCTRKYIAWSVWQKSQEKILKYLCSIFFSLWTAAPTESCKN